MRHLRMALWANSTPFCLEQKIARDVDLQAKIQPRKEPIMHDYGGWMWFVIDVVMVAALAAALIYGIGMWRKRQRNHVTQEVRDEATERLYREGQ
jgi:hypothetical protein